MCYTLEQDGVDFGIDPAPVVYATAVGLHMTADYHVIGRCSYSRLCRERPRTPIIFNKITVYIYFEIIQILYI